MTGEQIHQRFAEVCGEPLPRPGCGHTAERHRRIFAAGREDLSLAKLAEAHWDAVAILQEAGRDPVPGARYAVWASEIPGRPVEFAEGTLRGTKEFCSGTGLVDRALVSAGPYLLEIDTHASPERLGIDRNGWQTDAFRETATAALSFKDYPVAAVVGEANWYVERPGFWQGACGPAAAWAGGAAGLVDYAFTTRRDDAHTLAHLAAMQANVLGHRGPAGCRRRRLRPQPRANASVRALQVRHLVEQILHRHTSPLRPRPWPRSPHEKRRRLPPLRRTRPLPAPVPRRARPRIAGPRPAGRAVSVVRVGT